MSQVQPRVLVVQCLIGDFPLANLYLNEFMPTVRSWANRMNYSYQLLDKKLFDFRCGAFELIAQRFSFFCLYEEFDYLIYVDADIAVTKAAGSIPYVDFGAVIDAEGSANEVKDFFHSRSRILTRVFLLLAQKWPNRCGGKRLILWMVIMIRLRICQWLIRIYLTYGLKRSVYLILRLAINGIPCHISWIGRIRRTLFLCIMLA